MLNEKTKPDASSRFQDSLPMSSDKLMGQLDEWGIIYKCYSHVPLGTVDDAKLVQNQFLDKDKAGGHIKNLYLRDHKKNDILLVVEQDCIIDLKKLKNNLGMGRLSFGSPARLFENLGVRPGAVTPFSMITGVNKGVKLFLDFELSACLEIYAHPLVNDRTLEISMENLLKFFEKIGVIPNWINFLRTEDTNKS